LGVTSKVLLSTKLPTCAPGAPDRSLHGHGVVGYKKLLFDVFSGIFKIVGTTAVAGTPDIPVSRRVNLMLRKSGRLARAKISNADGSYEFLMVGPGPWFVTGHDHTDEYNAVIADNIYGTPV
jgi:hypothetical protein